MSEQKRACDGTFWTGPRRNERCFHPAKWWVPTYKLHLCGLHRRAYTQAWPWKQP